jgi:hypothetical protein
MKKTIHRTVRWVQCSLQLPCMSRSSASTRLPATDLEEYGDESPPFGKEIIVLLHPN